MRQPVKIFQTRPIVGRRTSPYSGPVASPAAIPSFDIIGPAEPATPVIVSVPHAGRDYSPALTAALRVPVDAIRALEDRHVDAVARAARGTETMLIQRRPRAWIDLNRAERDRDPRVEAGGASALAMLSAKAKSGLGLIPRRVSPVGDIWKWPIEAEDVRDRIARDHRPYHAMLTRLLAAARARFGVAVLIDLHSMPPLAPPHHLTRLVIGDRFGTSAGARIVAQVEGAAAGHGMRAALNAPYAGGHILDRHGDPARGIHAIQIELDRRLYLDPALDRPDPEGVAASARLVRRLIDAIGDAITVLPAAAE